MAANTFAPSGFQTLRRYDGAAPNYATRSLPIAYNYTAHQIAYGDPVILFTDGTIQLMLVAGSTVHGIFRGCKYLNPSSGRTEWFPYWSAPTLPSTTTVEAFIDMDPLLTFMAQASGTALTQSAIGQNIDIKSGTSGVPGVAPAGISTCALDAANVHTTNTLPFRILKIVTAPGPSRTYDPTFDNQWLEVMMNTPDYPSGTRTGQA